MNDLVIQNVVVIPVLWRNGVSASSVRLRRDMWDTCPRRRLTDLPDCQVLLGPQCVGPLMMLRRTTPSSAGTVGITNESRLQEASGELRFPQGLCGVSGYND